MCPPTVKRVGGLLEEPGQGRLFSPKPSKPSKLSIIININQEMSRMSTF